MFGLLKKFTLGGKIALGLGALVAMMIVGFLFYFNHAENRKEELARELAIAEAGKASLEQTVQALNEFMTRQAQGLDRLNREISGIRRDSNELIRIITEGNIAEEAQADPRELERRLNRATREIAIMFEMATDPSRYEIGDSR